MTLSQLFQQIGHTDKHNNINHTYGDIYEQWIAPYVNKEINLLEIGCSLYGGGSLLAFAEFLNKATIYGLDNDYHNYIMSEHPRIKLITTDAYDVNTIGLFGDTKFNVIIDDCLHDKAHQSQALKIYWQLLNHHGIYVVEDLQQDFIDECESLTLELNANLQICDMRTIPMNDNVLVKFTKVSN